MIVDKKVFTSKAFLWCMNFSFVLGMSQLDNTLFGKCIETVFVLCGIFFFMLHFMTSAQIQWKAFIGLAFLIVVGLIALWFSGGATLLKLVLFFAITQKVSSEEILKSFIQSLMIPLSFTIILSLLGVLDLYYEGEKNALEFGMINPNTIPVIVFAIIVAYNLLNEKRITNKIVFFELIISCLLYYFCKARTAGIILSMYIVCVGIFKKKKKISGAFWILQYTFLLGTLASYVIIYGFRERTPFWLGINNILSGRPWAWDLYFSQYGVKFLGQYVDLTMAALDNAYLRSLIQYGFLVFCVYLFIFVLMSRYAYKNNKIVLLASIVAYEAYFMAEFGPMLINFNSVLMYGACIMLNYRKNDEGKRRNGYTEHLYCNL